MSDRPIRLIYFAWVRERIGCSEEDVVLPDEVKSVRDLLLWLRDRGEGYENALSHPEVIRVAINQEHVAHGESLADAREVALFPPMTGG
ncbi:molybdopterin converting factor subunit 1 [Pseudaminobacter sp. 19-2017]|uniref:Molybdopterin converting factor subunit 1 n=1 Tax=Pseudaminobacter soli (ex Zhang et al. 2022) TaxID=2831468 RepID=A0A942DZX6_9HYPH|nr:molybdopterin converting factor subunit 1 [Pseudaminobacter soli]MBS3651294.1 molybdopterin converting factor subunit 1 [Pseudaminobacter soli]